MRPSIAIRIDHPVVAATMKCPVCCKTFEDGYCRSGKQKLWQHMGTTKAHRRQRYKMDWDWDTESESESESESEPGPTECPVCGKKFAEGYHHSANQKLWQHMGSTKAHRRERYKMDWDRDWAYMALDCPYLLGMWG
jgi:uncharacterized protein (DUF2225 family)